MLIVCAESSEKAEEIALSSIVWGIQKEKGQGQEGVPSINEANEYQVIEKKAIEKHKQSVIIGNPQEVVSRLRELQVKYQADELMLVTIMNSIEDRIQSYKLVMEEMKK